MEYRTRDIYLTAYLVHIGEKIIDIESDDRNVTTFIFEQRSYLPKTVDDFFNKRTSVEPLSFAIQLKTIKAKIYEQKAKAGQK